jgi:NADH-quinone oxidoreductase subunit C
MNDFIPPAEWASAVSGIRDEGYRWFDWLDCVDEIGRANEFRLVLQLLDRATGASRRLETRLDRDRPEVATLSELYAGAGWAEREIHDLFGVTFLGGDGTPLLLDQRYGGHPLRKEEVLGARAAMSWPGAKEPGESDADLGVGGGARGGRAPSRRRMVPPGVPDPAVWGDRDPSAPPATAEEIAASAQGGRVRRRR